MDRVPVRCDIARHWDELPVEDCEIMSNDAGFFDDFEGDDGWWLRQYLAAFWL
jgi:hypothetical protein